MKCSFFLYAAGAAPVTVPKAAVGWAAALDVCHEYQLPVSCGQAENSHRNAKPPAET
jgi:hypothetical protein